MGAEHLLGKGDMLFLPPGSSRLTRVHGAFVTETEINKVVDFWKAQAQAGIRPVLPDRAAGGRRKRAEAEEAIADEQDPMYEEALRVVLEMGKASTSTLQRRLRLRIWPRGAHSGHDASRRDHRPARWQQAARSSEAA